MIVLAAFLRGVQAIIDEKPRYQLGGFGLRGICDCIGLIIGAIRRAGGEWKGTHGSNWALRNAMLTRRNITSASTLRVGEAVYKYRDPGQAGYSLPEAYRGLADQRDYYHVGVVMSVSPLRIAHCTSWSGGSGIKIDTVIGAWRVAGWLKSVADGTRKESQEVEEMGEQMVVTAQSGSNVRMRAGPGASTVIVANVPLGARVEVLEKRADWIQIRHQGKTGWMMAQHLRQAEQSPIDHAAIAAELEGVATRLTGIAKALRG